MSVSNLAPLLFICCCCTFAHAATQKGVSETSFRFVREPEDAVVQKNEPAILHCSVEGGNGNNNNNNDANSNKIKWKRDGEFLSFPDSNDRRRLLSNGSLYFSKVYHTRVHRPDEGLYQCVATASDVGTIISRTATLKVAGLASSFTSEPSPKTVFLGDTAVFECSIQSVSTTTTNSNNPYTLTWYKDDTLLSEDHRVKVLNSGMLEITDVKMSDRGSYKCKVAASEDESKTSQSAALRISLANTNVPTQPTFLAVPRNQKALEGNTVTLDCAANGRPTPIITWLKDGATINTDSRVSKVGGGSLVISSVGVSDEGTYQCRAENSEDSVDAAAVLEVMVAPKFVRSPEPLTEAGVKADVELQCEVYSQPTAAVQWYKNGDLIIESEYFQIIHGTNLKILGLVEDDSGMYQCFASNPAGNAQAAARLRVRPKDQVSKDEQQQPNSVLKASNNNNNADNVFKKGPGPPADVTAVIVSTRFITLSWSRPAHANGEIEGYSVFYKQEGSDRERVLNSTDGNLEEMNVQGLLPGTRYLMRVLAHNEHGSGESSSPLPVSTQEEVDVPGPVGHLAARPTSSFSILVTWGKPVHTSAIVTHYKLYYRQADHMDVHSLTSTQPQHHLTDLHEFTEYTFWASAFSSNGEGAFSEEVTARTHSDIPADPPQNVTLEADSSKSIIARWEPPPKESQNGLITGYKIRWRAEGNKGSNGDVITTDGSRRLFAITGLKNGNTYQVKMSAMTVNGSGPSTNWISQKTFESDLDESVVPEPPSSLRAKARDDEIMIMWSAPADNRILVRGYTIGWGKGIPDEYTKVVDDKQRQFAIRNLKPNSEYVISLRAYNGVGDGRPIYETVRTRDEEEGREEDTPLQPPIGLHARILSSKTALLTWMDSSLPQNQLIPDNRYYIVRYSTAKSLHSSKPKHQYRNSTDLNIMVDDLKPNTEYEFVVKVVKGKRQSRWSMVTLNTTREAAPGSPPRDLVIRSQDQDSIVLNWRAPKFPNGQINGYLIQYTTDKRAEEREWYVEAVVGDETTAVIQNLSPETKYYFKMGARNNKGYGPYSPVVAYLTPKLGGGVSSNNNNNNNGDSNNNNKDVSPVVLYAVAGVGAGIMLVVVVAAAILIHRCGQNSGAALVVAADRLNKSSYLSAETGLGGIKDRLNPPPPDLWIGHDQLELKAMEEEEDNDETGETSLAGSRSTPMGNGDYRSASSMDRSRNNYILPYSGTESEISFSLTGGGSRNGGGKVRRTSKLSSTPNPGASGAIGKPVKIAAINGKPRVQRYLSHESVASSSHPGSSCNGSSSTYIRSQYHLNPPSPMLPPMSGDDLPPPGYEPAPSERSQPSTIEESATWVSNNHGNSEAIAVAPPQLPPSYLSSALSTSSADSSSGSGSGATRSSRQSNSTGSGATANMMKSFTGSNLPGQPKNLVRPQPTSPFKRHLLGVNSSLGGSLPFPGHTSSLLLQQKYANGGDNVSTNGTPLHSGQLPAVANVRSPDVLHPQEGPCDCLTHTIMPSLSTEELNAEMKNLEGLMKDLSSISRATKQQQQQQYPC